MLATSVSNYIPVRCCSLGQSGANKACMRWEGRAGQGGASWGGVAWIKSYTYTTKIILPLFTCGAKYSLSLILSFSFFVSFSLLSLFLLSPLPLPTHPRVTLIYFPQSRNQTASQNCDEFFFSFFFLFLPFSHIISLILFLSHIQLLFSLLFSFGLSVYLSVCHPPSSLLPRQKNIK